MKKLFIIFMVLMLCGCAAKRGPVIRTAHLFNNNNVAVWDQARHIKSFLYATVAISEGANDYIEKILARVKLAHTNAVNATSAYNNGALSFYQLELALQQAYNINLEIFSTLTAFMLAEGYKE